MHIFCHGAVHWRGLVADACVGGSMALSQAGNEARTRFLKANERLVFHVARKYINRGLDIEVCSEALLPPLPLCLSSATFLKSNHAPTFASLASRYPCLLRAQNKAFWRCPVQRYAVACPAPACDGCPLVVGVRRGCSVHT